MTVPATARRAGPFNGNGVTTSFPFTFKVFAAADIEVVLADADGLEETLVLGSDYSVTVNADQDASPGGSIVYPLVGTPLPTGSTLTARGAIPYDQTLDLPGGGAFNPRAIENALDRTTYQVQQLAEELGRSLTLPLSAAGANTELPVPAAGRVIGWDDTASGLRNIDPATLASIVAYANRRTLVANGGAASYTLEADPGNASNTLVAVGGVVQTPGVDYTVSGTTLTPVGGPWPVGTNNVVVIYGEALPVGTQSSDAVNVTLPGGVTRTLTQALANREIHLDYYVADPTNATAGINTALALAAVRGGVVRGGRKTYTSAPFTLPAGVSLVGEGANEGGDSETEDATGATVFRIDATGTNAAITLAGRDCRLEGFKLVNANAAVGGRGISAPEVYFMSAERVYVEGFADNWHGTKSLYWTLRRCRGTAGTRGLTLTGTSGVWNTDWFNNAIVLDNCQFGGNTEHGIRIKGFSITLIGTTAEVVRDAEPSPTSGRGMFFEGESLTYPAQVTIINPYIERVWMPYTFRFCRATILDGFTQGWTTAPTGSALVDADNSTVEFLGTHSAFDLFANRFRLRNSARVLIKANPAVASTDDIDGTSAVAFTGVDSGTFTGTVTGCTTSPTGTVRYHRNGALVGLYIPTISGTSNSTACTVTGIPAALRPTNTQRTTVNVLDSGASFMGVASIDSGGVITLSRGAIGAAFTNSGTKGVQESVIFYLLT